MLQITGQPVAAHEPVSTHGLPGTFFQQKKDTLPGLRLSSLPHDTVFTDQRIILPAGLPGKLPVADSTPSRNHWQDSLAAFRDSAASKIAALYARKKEQLTSTVTTRLRTAATLPRFTAGKDTALPDPAHPFAALMKTRPLLSFNGGYAAYAANYRSAIDTPLAEKNILQHTLTGNLLFTVAGQLPFRVQYWVRRSNSVVFRNMVDVQLSFSGADYRNALQSAVRNRLLALSAGLQDSLTEKLAVVKKLQLANISRLLSTLFSIQHLVEANEVLQVPHITYEASLPDSVNERRADSLKKAAALFLDAYHRTQQAYNEVKAQADSLEAVYQKSLLKVQQFRQFINRTGQSYTSQHAFNNELSQYGLADVEIPARYRWLMGVRNFSIGRSQVNYSELTAKNTSVNGLNFEYNSWYYLALTAGTVNYRFRDFVVKGSSRKPQYLYMVRAGIGRLDRHYFIVSAFRGQKQLFASAGYAPVKITGLSAETRWRINNTTYLTAEVAKSIAPDLRNNPSQGNTKLNLSDKSNQAVALRINSVVPVIYTRIDAFYKQAGANYQSFTSFQTNAAQESWYVKADQQFFRRKLRLAASLRKNEYANPFLQQSYKSNTVFKSLTATWRLRKWPVITVGYQPMSQLTVLDNQVIENRFQTLYGSAYYLYSLQQLRMATTVMYNKFYNGGSDTGFLYYNATHLYCAQELFFKGFTTHVAASRTRNSSYRLDVLDGCIQPNFPRLGTISIGIKINNLNNAEVKAGGYLNANIRVHRQDMVTVSFERGFLPGYAGGLIRNDMGSVQFIKTFGGL